MSSDIYEIDPSFVEQHPGSKPRLSVPVQTMNQTMNQSPNPQSNTQPNAQSVVVQESSMAAFFTANKTMIIIGVAILVVLIILFLYWYLSSPKEQTLGGPGPPNLNPNPGPNLNQRRQPMDNIAPPDLQNIPNKPSVINQTQQKPRPPPLAPPDSDMDADSERPPHSVPITHEELVLTTDDLELDKYMNPGEKSLDQQDNSSKHQKSKKSKSQEQTKSEKQKASPQADVEPIPDDLLDDLKDLED